MEQLGDMGHVEYHFGPLEIVFVLVQDRSIVCAKRTIASKIVLHVPDGTPRGEAEVEARFDPI
jgi:rRNA processing protein Gar1